MTSAARREVDEVDEVIAAEEEIPRSRVRG